MVTNVWRYIMGCRGGSPFRNNYHADWHTTQETPDMGRYEEQKDASRNTPELFVIISLIFC